MNNLYPEQHLLPAEMLHHNTEWVADGAAKFISMPRRSPFFLHVAFTLPHNPDAGDSLQADPRYTPGGLWACNRSAVAANREAVLRLVNGHDASGARHGGGAPPREPRLGHKHYPLALAWMDSGIGLVVQALTPGLLPPLPSGSQTAAGGEPRVKLPSVPRTLTLGSSAAAVWPDGSGGVH